VLPDPQRGLLQHVLGAFAITHDAHATPSS